MYRFIHVYFYTHLYIHRHIPIIIWSDVKIHFYVKKPFLLSRSLPEDSSEDFNKTETLKYGGFVNIPVTYCLVFGVCVSSLSQFSFRVRDLSSVGPYR